MEQKSNPRLRLVDASQRVVMPHDTVLVGPDKLAYRLDSWEASGAVYVYEYPGKSFRQRRYASEFGLKIVELP